MPVAHLCLIKAKRRRNHIKEMAAEMEAAVKSFSANQDLAGFAFVAWTTSGDTSAAYHQRADWPSKLVPALASEALRELVDYVDEE